MVEILREAEETSVATAAKKNAVSEQTVDAWRQHFAGLEPSDVRKLGALKAENAKLKRLLTEGAGVIFDPRRIDLPVMRTPSAALRAAYEATLYEVAGPVPAVLRIGDKPGRHDRWLERLNSRRALIVTAWNPFSSPVSQADNAAANARLANAAGSHGLAFAPACGRDPAGGWSEESLCVFDAPDSLVDEWLCEFRQNAALQLIRGARPELVWHPALRERASRYIGGHDQV